LLNFGSQQHVFDILIITGVIFNTSFSKCCYWIICKPDVNLKLLSNRAGNLTTILYQIFWRYCV